MLFDRDKPLEEREYPDEADLAEGDEPIELSRCPACGELIHEGSPQCPHCREWIVASGPRWRQSRKWYVRGGLYMSKTLLWNWVAWLVLAVAGAIAAFLAILELGR